MTAVVEAPHRHDLEHHAGDERGGHRQHDGGDEAAGPHREGRGEIGAEHVERAMRQIDQVHNAEHERQPGGQEKQQHAQLHAVEALLDEIQHGLKAIGSRRRHPAAAPRMAGRWDDGWS